MVDEADALLQRLRREVDDPRVLEAIARTPRAPFVAPRLRGAAWENRPLPLPAGQTVSQPLVVARMCALLELGRDDHVLDVGTGSGWHAAVLARLACHVWSVERHAGLSAQAARNLDAAGVANVTLLVGDGARGFTRAAPYDAINVAAAAARWSSGGRSTTCASSPWSRTSSGPCTLCRGGPPGALVVSGSGRATPSRLEVAA